MVLRSAFKGCNPVSERVSRTFASLQFQATKLNVGSSNDLSIGRAVVQKCWQSHPEG